LVLLKRNGLARDLLKAPHLYMDSNRMRLYTRGKRFASMLAGSGVADGVNLDEIPAPVAIVKPAPEQIVQDIVLSTLARIQESGSPEIAAAAAHYITRIRAEMP
jgi:hypothetical protein